MYTYLTASSQINRSDCQKVVLRWHLPLVQPLGVVDTSILCLLRIPGLQEVEPAMLSSFVLPT